MARGPGACPVAQLRPPMRAGLREGLANRRLGGLRVAWTKGGRQEPGSQVEAKPRKADEKLPGGVFGWPLGIILASLPPRGGFENHLLRPQVPASSHAPLSQFMTQKRKRSQSALCSLRSAAWKPRVLRSG